TRKGRRVGVHTAQQNGNGKWEFRFPERTLNVLVLLTEEKDGSLRDYVLPPKVLQENWKKFLREKGSVVVELKTRGQEVVLLLPKEILEIEEYKSNYSALQ